MTDVLERGPAEEPVLVDLDDADPAPSSWEQRSDRRRAVEIAVSIVVVGGAVLFTLAQLHPGLLFSNSTPTGGDMGAHVWGPAYLRDHLLPQLPADRVGQRLVRRLPDLHLLHAAAGAAGGAVRRPAPLWRGAEDRQCPRHPDVAHLLLGLREAVGDAVPGAAAARGGVGRLPLRRDLPDLRREHRLDDGGGVLVLDRAVAGDAVLRCLRLRAAHRQAPCPGRRAVRPGLPQPRHRHLLRGRRRPRAVRPPPPPVDPRPDPCRRDREGGAHHDGRGRAAERVLGHPVRPAAPLRHRHVLRAQQQLRRHAVPPGRRLRLAPHGGRRHRVARCRAAALAQRALPRHHDGAVRRLGRGDAAEPAVEQPAPAVHVPDALHARGRRHRRDRPRHRPAHQPREPLARLEPPPRHARPGVARRVARPRPPLPGAARSAASSTRAAGRSTPGPSRLRS